MDIQLLLDGESLEQYIHRQKAESERLVEALFNKLESSPKPLRKMSHILRCREQIELSVYSYLVAKPLEKKILQRSAINTTVNELQQMSALMRELESFFGGTRDLSNMSKALLQDQLGYSSFDALEKDIQTASSIVSGLAKKHKNRISTKTKDNHLLVERVANIADSFESTGLVISSKENSTFVQFIEVLLTELDISANPSHFASKVMSFRAKGVDSLLA